MALQRDTFISLVGSLFGGEALLQTKRTARMPISSFGSNIHLRHKLDEVEKEERKVYPLIVKDLKRKRTEIVESEGFGLYHWLPPNNHSVTRLSEGSFIKGIELIRGSDPFLKLSI